MHQFRLVVVYVVGYYGYSKTLFQCSQITKSLKSPSYKYTKITPHLPQKSTIQNLKIKKSEIEHPKSEIKTLPLRHNSQGVPCFG